VCRVFSAGTKIVVTKKLGNTIWQCFWKHFNKVLWTIYAYLRHLESYYCIPSHFHFFLKSENREIFGWWKKMEIPINPKESYLRPIRNGNKYRLLRREKVRLDPSWHLCKNQIKLFACMTVLKMKHFNTHLSQDASANSTFWQQNPKEKTTWKTRFQ
jgi:hypothetical protein